MEIKELLLYIENHGISLVFMLGIGIALWRVGIPAIKEHTKLLIEIKKFFEEFNKGVVRSKGLKLLLELKCQEIRWSIENKYIEYIQRNNIKENWENIVSELKGHTTKKLINLDEDLHDITDKISFNASRMIFNKAIEENTKDLLPILEELKGGNGDYEVAQRSVKVHMEHFQNKLLLEIGKLFD